MSAQTHSWPLDELLHGYSAGEVDAGVLITGMTMDSRDVHPGDLFLACKGQTTHGLSYAPQAVSGGATAIAYEPDSSVAPDFSIPVVAVPRLSKKVGKLADRFFASPSRHLAVVGVTGTNGKTSVTDFISQALKKTSGQCGVLGTLGYGLAGDLEPGAHTTPDVVKVHEWLARFVAADCDYAVMEVSSHALDQNRVDAVRFTVAVFTNISRDHLDYHGDMASYVAAKQQLFSWPELEYAVINADDDMGREWLSQLPRRVTPLAYSLDEPVVGIDSIYARALSSDATGMQMEVVTPWGDITLRTALLGRFNAANLLAAMGVLLRLGFPLEQVGQLLADSKPVSGRMERFGLKDQPLVVVDYAHTPDALEQAILALRDHFTGKLVCVFGCGGDRDQGKRPLMGAVAERLADQVIVTDDNPRSEDPDVITDQILSGINDPSSVLVIHDRRDAIARAINGSTPADCVLVAGKGHETVQVTGNQILPFDDREIVRACLREYGV